MEFPRQEYLSGLLFPSPADIPYPGIEPTFSALAGGFFTTEPPGKSSKLSTHTHIHTSETGEILIRFISCINVSILVIFCYGFVKKENCIKTLRKTR